MKAVSPLNTIVVISAPPVEPGFQVQNYGEGADVISIKRLKDTVTHKMGADGKMTIVVSADRSGEIALKLTQASSSNKKFARILQFQEGGPQTFAPVKVLFQDVYRNDTAEGSFGYIKGWPEIKRGDGVDEQVWTVVVEDLLLVLGDPAFAAFATVGSEAAG